MSPRTRFKQQMIILMRASKNYPELSQVSANAVTVLCRLGMRFFGGEDFSGVSWKGADLTGSCWDQVNFSDADFTRADLRHTWFNQCNFTRANLSQIQLGELPAIEGREGETIEAIALNPKDSAMIAVATGNDILVYDRIKCEELGVLTGHTDTVTCLCFSPDGTLLATGGNDRLIMLWSVQQQSSSFFKGHEGEITCLSFSPDGNHLASGSVDCTVKLWDVQKKEIIRTLDISYDVVSCLSYDNAGIQLAFGSFDTVYIWDVNQRKLSTKLQKNEENIKDLSYSPNGTQLAVISRIGNDVTLRLWNTKNWSLEKELGGYKSSMYFRYSPDGESFAIGSLLQQDIVQLWNVRQDKCVATFDDCENYISSLCYSPDGRQLAVGTHDTENEGNSTHRIYVFDVQQRKLIRTLEGHLYAVSLLYYTLDGEQLISGNNVNDRLGIFGEIRFWDMRQNKLNSNMKFLEGHYGDIMYLDFSPVMNQVATGGGYKDGKLRLWDIENGKLIHVFDNGFGVWAEYGFGYSPDGSQLASVYCNVEEDKNVINLWDSETGRCVRTLEGHKKFINCLSYSPDGLQIASSDKDGTVRLWDLQSGECIRVFEQKQVKSIAFSSTKQLAVVSKNKLVLWNVKEEKSSYIFESKKDIICLRYSPDRSQLAFGGADTIVYLLDSQQGKMIHLLNKHKASINCLAFSPNGSELASGSFDKTVMLWDSYRGKLLHMLQGHKSSINCLSYSSNGSQLASGSRDESVRIWDTRSGRCLQIWSYMLGGGFTALLWRQEWLLMACQRMGLLIVLERNEKGMFTLKWLQSSRLPVLSFNGSQFIDTKGLKENEITLIQRGGEIPDVTEEKTGEIKDSLLQPDLFTHSASEMGTDSVGSLSAETTPSTSLKLSSPANTLSSLFGRPATFQMEEKRTKKTATLPSIPAPQGSFLISLEIETPRPRRYSAPGRL